MRLSATLFGCVSAFAHPCFLSSCAQLQLGRDFSLFAAVVSAVFVSLWLGRSRAVSPGVVAAGLAPSLVLSLCSAVPDLCLVVYVGAVGKGLFKAGGELIRHFSIVVLV